MYTTYNTYSTQELSAYGLGDEGSGGGLVQNVYGSSNLGNLFSDSTLTDTFNAYTINRLHERVQTLEAGGTGGTEYILPTATSTTLGGIKVGQRLSINNGILSADVQPNNYSLPTASTTTLGGIKVGSGLTISSGVLSVVGGGSSGSSVVWGTESGGYVPLTVEGVSKSVALSTHTHSQYALTTHNHSGVYEPVFSKNTAFNKDFGTTSTTVARGNDSRIVNGQTAYG